jgi:HK97 family phage major capsid protein
MSVTATRLERVYDERERVNRNIDEMRSTAERDDGRDLTESENEMVETWRTRVAELDNEIGVLAEDLERENNSRDVSALLRANQNTATSTTGGTLAPSVQIGDNREVYRTFAAYALDRIVADFPQVASLVHGPDQATVVRTAAEERLQRAVQHTLSSNVPGLLPPQHIDQIMDIINVSRPVVATARQVALERGSLTYPKIAQRPTVAKQTTEKTEGGTANMQITLETMTSDTYIGGGNLSWQTINWSTPSALQLWFDLAAESYGIQTETAACAVLEAAGAGIGTASTPLGTVGTEVFSNWTAAALSGIAGIYSATGGRASGDTLYLSAARFFQLAALGTTNVTNMVDVGNLELGTLTGTWRGLRVVGSYGFTNANTAIVGDSRAFLVGENPGAPVEMRAVEPTIGGMEVGVIGAFKATVFDTSRFKKLT